VVSKAAPPAAAAAATSTSPISAPAVVAGRFLWPLHGETLRRFGGKNGSTSKGMELAAAANTPVVAAAAGRVIYSGDGIRSYGNLIILKHDESFFTVYGYNERNLVQAGSFVSKGEKIALVGTPPEGGRARLYFELRYGKEAVDPTIYLP
jgi:lipoprotein NlpD